jgi:DNA-binding transcriptional MerR regulator
VQDPLITAEEAAAWFGVTASGVRTWVQRFNLTVQGRRGNANLYRFSALVDAERRTRLSHNCRHDRFGGSVDKNEIARHTAF